MTGYAERLSEAGIEVQHQVVPGADHYFLDGDPARARATLDRIAHGLDRSYAVPRD